MQLGVLEKNTSPSRPPRGVLPPWQVGRWGLCPGSPLLLTPTLPRPRQDIASLAFPEQSQSRGRRCCPREPRPASSRTQKIPARDPARAGSLIIARDPDSAPTAPRGRRARPRAKRSRGRCGASWPDSGVGGGGGWGRRRVSLRGQSHTTVLMLLPEPRRAGRDSMSNGCCCTEPGGPGGPRPPRERAGVPSEPWVPLPTHRTSTKRARGRASHAQCEHEQWGKRSVANAMLALAERLPHFGHGP